MVAGLPGADRRALVVSVGVNSPELCDYYYRCYKDSQFDPNPGFDGDPVIQSLRWHTKDFTYETSLCYFCVDDIITILDDLIDEKL